MPYHIYPEVSTKGAFGAVRRELGKVFHRFAEQKGHRIEEGHVMSDQVHMLIGIPPKLEVSSVVGYLKGSSAIIVLCNF